MAGQNISVKISGTPVRKGGFIPMVNINDAFFEISDTYPALMSRDACVYTVSVCPDMTVYKLVFFRMRHHGDGSEARLVIGFSIPAGFTLPDGKDAAGVLHTLLEAFIGSFGLALPDGAFEYRFGRFDTGILENICKSIELIPDDCHRVVMKEDARRGAIEVSGERITTALSCLDREEYADISELIVAEHINASVGGIGVILKDERPVAEERGEELSEDIAMPAPEDKDAADDLSVPAMPAETDEGSNIGNDILYPDTKIRQDVSPEDQNPSRGRRLWPTLMAGVLLGAVIAYLALRLFDGHPDVSQEMPVAADTSAVVRMPDTVAPAKVETVFIEKKVVVEKPRPRPSAKQGEGRSRAAKTSSSGLPQEAEVPAANKESTPAPVYKYDPEAERSL